MSEYTGYRTNADDYTVGTVTLTAGSKDFTVAGAFIDSKAAAGPGDEIYIPDTAKVVIIESVIDDTKGTLAYPCPTDCAGENIPLRIRYKPSSTKVRSRSADIFGMLSSGNLPSISEVEAEEGQILVAGSIPGEWEAKNLSDGGDIGDMMTATYDPTGKKADAFSMANMSETVSKKIMTDSERQAIISHTASIADQTSKITIIDTTTSNQAASIAANTSAIADMIEKFDKIDLSQLLPTGTVLKYTSDTMPDGFLLCNGQAVSRTTYAKLFSVIGGTFGAGDGRTTFNVPDLRGLFVRGVDGGRGIDGGRVLGSYQEMMIQNHVHDYNMASLVGNIAQWAAVGQPVVNTSSQKTGSAGGNETRPKNLALHFMIKT